MLLANRFCPLKTQAFVPLAVNGEGCERPSERGGEVLNSPTATDTVEPLYSVGFNSESLISLNRPFCEFNFGFNK